MGGLEAFALGCLAQSSLLLAGLAVYWVRPTVRVIGGLAGFGAGALISAVAFDMIPEAEGLDSWETAFWLLVGALIFVVADNMARRSTAWGRNRPSRHRGRLGRRRRTGVAHLRHLHSNGTDDQRLVYRRRFPVEPDPGPGSVGFSHRIRLALDPDGGHVGVVVAACAITSWLGYVFGNILATSGGRAAAITAGGCWRCSPTP